MFPQSCLDFRAIPKALYRCTCMRMALTSWRMYQLEQMLCPYISSVRLFVSTVKKYIAFAANATVQCDPPPNLLSLISHKNILMFEWLTVTFKFWRWRSTERNTQFEIWVHSSSFQYKIICRRFKNKKFVNNTVKRENLYSLLLKPVKDEI